MSGAARLEHNGCDDVSQQSLHYAAQQVLMRPQAERNKQRREPLRLEKQEQTQKAAQPKRQASETKKGAQRGQ